MKQQEEDTKKLIGKTISGVGFSYSSGIVLAFTDNTFWYVKATSGYEGELEIMTYHPFDLSETSAIDAGIMTKDEFDRRIEARRLERQKADERREKEEFERLKKKFGTNQP